MKNTLIRKAFSVLAIGAIVLVPSFAFASHDSGSDYHPELAENLNILFFGDPDGYQPEERYGSWEGGDPIVRTIGATNISRTRVTLQAYYSSGTADYNQTDNPKLYIQYGTDRDMEEMTEVVSQYLGSRTTSFHLTGLEPDETYYFRAVILFKDEIDYGDRMSFHTLGSGDDRVGQTITDDDVTLAGNINTLLFGSKYGNSNEPAYDTSGYASSGSGTTYGTNTTYTSSPQKQTVVKTKTAEAKTTTEKKGSILGNSNLGAGFFPNTLIGWLGILAILGAIIFVARKLSDKK